MDNKYCKKCMKYRPSAMFETASSTSCENCNRITPVTRPYVKTWKKKYKKLTNDDGYYIQSTYNMNGDDEIYC